MVDNAQLAKSKGIHRRTGKTFYYATRVLPQRVRRQTYILYAFFRVADEVVDDEASDLGPAAQREELLRIRDAALGREETDDPVLSAFDEVRAETGIADEDVEEFIDAMLTDIDKTRYETYDELEAYMRGSAAAVGRMMTAIMEPDDPDAALPHATALGEAFQLTNFIRDVREDIDDRDRVYLPQTTLAEYGVTDEQIERHEVTEGFRDAVRHELVRAEELYHEGVAGIKYLPEDCQFAVLLASVLYADHHRLVRDREYDTLSATPGLATHRKVWLVAKTRWHWAWNKDPEAVFQRVAPLRDHAGRTVDLDPPEGESVPTQ